MYGIRIAGILFTPLLRPVIDQGESLSIVLVATPGLIHIVNSWCSEVCQTGTLA